MSEAKDYLSGLWHIGRRCFDDLKQIELKYLYELSPTLNRHIIDDLFDEILEQQIWDDGAFRMPWQEPDEYLSLRQQQFGY